MKSFLPTGHFSGDYEREQAIAEGQLRGLLDEGHSKAEPSGGANAGTQSHIHHHTNHWQIIPSYPTLRLARFSIRRATAVARPPLRST